MTGHIPLGEGPEFDIVRSLLERWGSFASGIGDDAAVLDVPAGFSLVASTDSSIENVHFRREWLSPEEIGYRAAAAALSDLAAMGSEPLGILVAMGIPASWTSDVERIGDGIAEAASAQNASILGGDITAASELSLTLTVLGVARRPLSRNAAAPGDRVFVTGVLGGAMAALQALESGETPLLAARNRFAHPEPRIREACWLAERGINACIDISDGLSGDAAHIAIASGVALTIDLERLPLFEAATPWSAVASGEEYELLFTVPRDAHMRGFADRFDVELTEVGFVEEGPAAVVFRFDGKPAQIPSSFSHFTK